MNNTDTIYYDINDLLAPQFVQPKYPNPIVGGVPGTTTSNGFYVLKTREIPIIYAIITKSQIPRRKSQIQGEEDRSIDRYKKLIEKYKIEAGLDESSGTKYISGFITFSRQVTKKKCRMPLNTDAFMTIIHKLHHPFSNIINSKTKVQKLAKASHYIWPLMNNEIDKLIKKCVVCNKNANNRDDESSDGDDDLDLDQDQDQDLDNVQVEPEKNKNYKKEDNFGTHQNTFPRLITLEEMQEYRDIVNRLMVLHRRLFPDKIENNIKDEQIPLPPQSLTQRLFSIESMVSDYSDNNSPVVSSNKIETTPSSFYQTKPFHYIHVQLGTSNVVHNEYPEKRYHISFQNLEQINFLPKHAPLLPTHINEPFFKLYHQIQPISVIPLVEYQSYPYMSVLLAIQNTDKSIKYTPAVICKSDVLYQKLCNIAAPPVLNEKDLIQPPNEIDFDFLIHTNLGDLPNFTVN
ncbi:hypothetical protein DLAC_09780 [Tieghemostelium lacteum]|uniref:Uncharacterized protein n=1 Tax=Tieghemostelium lacteum TaxID=361077 RepID=A0A151Z771_TIELA|nr:hypothetical protein DLAC_09780 [Tieghemostelium lacteum]|eukprot:KYQ89809.1 hypothetical protein DLAC_09780 [Tieghemostelium lacteum]